MLTRRADAGDAPTAKVLAAHLLATGRLDGLRHRADRGDQSARRVLAQVLSETADVAELRRRADGRDPYAARTLADLQSGDEHVTEKIALLRVCVDEGLSEDDLVDFLHAEGRVAELCEEVHAGTRRAADRLADLQRTR